MDETYLRSMSAIIFELNRRTLDHPHMPVLATLSPVTPYLFSTMPSLAPSSAHFYRTGRTKHALWMQDMLDTNIGTPPPTVPYPK